MKAATDNAEELKTTLSRVMHRPSRRPITTEIMEIVGGAEALKGDKKGGDQLLLEHSSVPSTSSPTPDPTPQPHARPAPQLNPARRPGGASASIARTRRPA